MSFNAVVPTANTFIGIVAEVTRKDLAIQAESDKLRVQFWSQYMLPKLTDEFVSSVMKSEARTIVFSLPIPGFEDVKHVIVFQHYSHLSTSSLRTSLIPWQLRVVIGKPMQSLIMNPYELETKLVDKVFGAAGWKFYSTRSGFIIYPTAMFNELSDASAVFSAWMQTRLLGTPEASEAPVGCLEDADMPRLDSVGASD